MLKPGVYLVNTPFELVRNRFLLRICTKNMFVLKLIYLVYATKINMKSCWKNLLISHLVTLAGCIGVNRTQVKFHEELNQGNLSRLNGRYSNVTNDGDSLQNSSLWHQFSFLKKDTAYDWKNHEIELEVVNHKRIKAKLWNDNVLIDEKLIKGKLDEGFFSARRQLEVIGFPFIYFFYCDSKYEIAIDQNETLVLNRSTANYGNIFIMSAGNTADSMEKYDKKE